MVDQLLKRTPSGSEPVAYTLTTAGATLVGSGSKVADYPTLFAGVVMVIVGGTNPSSDHRTGVQVWRKTNTF